MELFNTVGEDTLMFGGWNEAVHKLRDVPGDFAEFGVFEGDKTIGMVRDAGTRTVWAWDTFEGMPDDNYIEALDKSDPPGKWMPAGDIVKKLEDLGVKVVKGKFSDTIPAFNQDVKFAFVHIDCDHYWAYKRVLEFITPRMSPGGIVRLDDYGCCDGARKATDEWLATVSYKLEGDWIYF
jgi:O-methyltransferase